MPKNRIFMAGSECENVKEGDIRMVDKRFGYSSMIWYVTEEKCPKSFDAIEKMLADKSLWDKNRVSKIDLKEKFDSKFNFLKIIGEEDRELAFSNMLAYFLDNKRNILKDFCKEVLEVDMDEQNADIRRELCINIKEKDKKASKYRIDLWIEDDKNIIVIENKIKSDVNGENKTQLKKYYDFAEGEAKKSGKKTHYYMFKPNYSDIDVKEYEGGSRYVLVNYSELYDFFSGKNVKFGDWRDDKRYYEDFCNALYRHTQKMGENYYMRMREEFVKRIKRVKKN